ncbi:alcohol dehydrogenase catalytic domain-containing protein [Nonomuraea rubra]|uniref:NADPH:quinone reductase-like Zn-dependent oxidoreductase n=2 Tax=Nonomuraea rubra TaxID=46180 RepID=A0A7X0P4Z5_9ACTN|nr:zinc-binding dehydrogenase [Nonomuraea rubra]MBB6555325.1 NADPH:quinone reductase-like Zn-dependent oxidoreductase [Nonomuraea rubra]
MGRILVTGATGTVGRHAVALLREAGAEVVALSGGDGDLRDPGTLPPLDGVTSALLIWPFATADGARDVLRALAGRRVVYLSSAARREGEREVERLVEEMAGEWTFLRPHAFAANALRWARQVRAGVVRGAYGAAGMPVVHERNIAAVAVRALLDAGHHGAAYTLTGPETLTQADQVRVISEVTGLPVRWEELSPEHARAALAAEGWPPGVVEEVLRAQAELVSRPLPVTSAVEEVTKAPARSFREWVREHADAFLWAPGGSRTGAVMRAARIHEFGDASVIRLDEVPIPRPGPGEVLLEVAATSFNPSEVGLRSGLLPEVFRASLPHTLGWDVSGTVVETGAGVSGLAPGDRVFGMADGAAAEYVVAPAGALARAPRSIPLADAAAVPVAGLTAWQAVHEHARLTPGQRVLVNGAGGGVGMFAVQLAKLAGAHVTATASPRSAAAVRRLGADDVIDYTTTPLPTDVDVLLNLIPNGPAGQSRTTVSIAGGEGHFVMRYDPDDLATLATLIDAGRLAVEIAESHPLTELPQIHQRAEAGDIRGKITILMA